MQRSDQSKESRILNIKESKVLCFAKQEPGWASQKFLATAYKSYLSALYMNFDPALNVVLVATLALKDNAIAIIEEPHQG